MEKIRLFVFDFDGTALGGHEPYAQFPPPFAAFLNRLAERGIQWATNTTWGVVEQLEVARRSGVTAPPGLLSGQTGRQLARVVDGELVVDEEHERFIAEQDEAFHERMWPRVREVIMALLAEDVVIRIGYDIISPQRLVDFTSRPGKTERMWELLEPLLGPGDYYPFRPTHEETGVLLPAHMNKGSVVRTMQERLGVSPAETLVAGDAFNDLPMFDPQLCGAMVCPGNADEITKAHLRAHGGVLAESEYSWGVIEGVGRILNDGEELV
jgi:hydroxymethylpyrimidine pyrophosphatase-like HAD family hydrolase